MFNFPLERNNLISYLSSIFETENFMIEKNFCTTSIRSENIVKLWKEWKQENFSTLFAHLEKTNLVNEFLRGVIDCKGNFYQNILETPVEFDSLFPFASYKKDQRASFRTGILLIDFLGMIYKYSDFARRSTVATVFFSNKPAILWAKTIENAPPPKKNLESDSGFDLHICKFIKKKDRVLYFDTGIVLIPEEGFYFDIVGRSSISKTGYMLANNIGIIDQSYRGSIIVALTWTGDEQPPKLDLPFRLVQAIPRRVILTQIPREIHSSEIDNTMRGNTGGLGSGSVYSA